MYIKQMHYIFISTCIRVATLWHAGIGLACNPSDLCGKSIINVTTGFGGSQLIERSLASNPDTPVPSLFISCIPHQDTYAVISASSTVASMILT